MSRISGTSCTGLITLSRQCCLRFSFKLGKLAIIHKKQLLQLVTMNGCLYFKVYSLKDQITFTIEYIFLIIIKCNYCSPFQPINMKAWFYPLSVMHYVIHFKVIYLNPSPPYVSILKLLRMIYYTFPHTTKLVMAKINS